MTASVTGFKGTLLLCDSAQAVGDKLYILGGGWSRVMKLQPAITMALAARWETPWHESNRKHKFRLALLTDDGRPAKPLDPAMDALGKPIPLHLEAEFEVGRPPGTTQGAPLVTVFAATFIANLDHGGYRWELSIDGKVLDAAAFEILAPPPGVIAQLQQPPPG